MINVFVGILLTCAVDMLGIPNAQEFANPDTSGDRILNGVNYASAAAGILDETGRHYVCILQLYIIL